MQGIEPGSSDMLSHIYSPTLHFIFKKKTSLSKYPIHAENHLTSNIQITYPETNSPM